MSCPLDFYIIVAPKYGWDMEKRTKDVSFLSMKNPLNRRGPWTKEQKHINWASFGTWITGSWLPPYRAVMITAPYIILFHNPCVYDFTKILLGKFEYNPSLLASLSSVSLTVC
jgi:hypothetical protein